MNPRRFCFVLVSIGMAAGLGAGCGDDDEKDAAGGRGGGAGRGGTSGSAGSGGKAGCAGSAAGCSGADASDGSSDAPTDTAAEVDAADASPVVTRCLERCTTNDDCRILGQETPLVDCSERGRCELLSTCSKRSDCYRIPSNWSVPCDAAQSCVEGMACVDVGQSRGVCAPLPGDGGCSLIFHPIAMPAFDRDAGSVQVCGEEADWDCGEGACYRRICTTDDQCSAPLSFCVVEKGVCGCKNDSECGAALGGAKCNVTTHRCGCVTDADCAGVPNADRCIDGVCGCSGNSVCISKAFAGTTMSCE
jgi:hypothetical protein